MDKATAKKKYIAVLISRLREINGDTPWLKKYDEILTNMSQSEFDKYMSDIAAEKRYATYVINAFDDVKKINIYKTMGLGKKYGIDFEQRILYTNPTTGEIELSDIPRVVGLMPVRRQQQHLFHKIAIANENNIMDALSGQTASVSRKSSLSRTEQFIVKAHGLTDTLEELVGPRGGNTVKSRNWYKQIVSSGDTNLDNVPDDGSRAKSSDTLNAYLKAMGIANTI